MSFFINNRERVRSNILNMFKDNDDSELVCSNKSSCSIDENDDIDSSLNLINETESTLKDLKNNHFEHKPDKDIDELDDSDDDDDDSKLEEQIEKNLQKINETQDKLNQLKIRHLNSPILNLEYEMNDDYINNLINQDIDDNLNVYVNVEKKPYKVEIHSSYEPDGEYTDEINSVQFNHCSIEYTNFDAFYENYFMKMHEKQFEIFNDIIVDNLINSHESIIQIMNNFRKNIVNDWVDYILTASRDYDINFVDPKKWVNRCDSILFDMYSKQPLIEYIKHVGSLLILFDSNAMFKLNEHMYKEIINKALEPIDMKKYSLNDIIEYYTRGKNVSKILVQDVTDNIKIKQNIRIMNLLITLYNQVTSSNLETLVSCSNDTSQLEKRIESHFTNIDNNQNILLNRPVVYVEPETNKVYIFDNRKLNERFTQGDLLNPYTNEPFDETFVKFCKEKLTKNPMLCNFCKDKLCDKRALKTIYQDPKYGPIIMKFCSIDCFSDIEWKPKVLKNAIII